VKARDIMTAHPSVVTPDDTVEHAARIMRDRHVGMLPVIDSLHHLHLMGIVTDRDIVVRCLAEGHGGACRVRDHMSSQHLQCVAVDADVAEVGSRMRANHLRRVPVLASDGRLVGVIALADLAARLRPSDPVLIETIEAGITHPHGE
jgi:CBS domain-containing protein